MIAHCIVVYKVILTGYTISRPVLFEEVGTEEMSFPSVFHSCRDVFLNLSREVVRRRLLEFGRGIILARSNRGR